MNLFEGIADIYDHSAPEILVALEKSNPTGINQYTKHGSTPAEIKGKHKLSPAMFNALRDSTGYDPGDDKRTNAALKERGFARTELSIGPKTAYSRGQNRYHNTHFLTDSGRELASHIKSLPASYAEK